MLLDLQKPAIRMLNLMLRDTNFLPINELQPPLKQYAAPDVAGMRQVAALKTWLENHVFDQPGNKFPERKKVGLKKGGVDRLKTMLDHYERLGGLAALTEMYCQLRDCLDGKEYEEEDLFEDPEGEVSDEMGEVKGPVGEVNPQAVPEEASASQ